MSEILYPTKFVIEPIATIPHNVIMQMINHPLTTSGIEKFLKDWESVPK